MNRTRDFRRHQMWKHKREAIKRLKQWLVNNDDSWIDDKQIGFFATTPHACSKRCCNRAREWEGETLQERKNWLYLLDELPLDK